MIASIDRGLSESRYGIIILSKKYFEKRWTQRELSALINKEVTSGRRIILPILHNMSNEEVKAKSPLLAPSFVARSSEGVPEIARKLYNLIREIEVPNLSSDVKLKEEVSKLFGSVKAIESLLDQTKEKILTIILTKIYLVSDGYRNVFIYYYPFSDLLCSNEEETQRLDEVIDALLGQNLIRSKALGTFSITHQGIKKIENLLERSFQADSDKASLHIAQSISEDQKQEITHIQKLRFDVLKDAFDMFERGVTFVNIHEIGRSLGIEKEDFNRIYFYLEDEGLIEFYALGGSFFITDKGKTLIEKSTSNRIY
jgi:predicted transcriptional regulator